MTTLALSGVPLAVAQKIARHSTPTLTANVYAVVGVSDLKKAVETVPAFVPQMAEALDEPESERAE